MVFFFQRFKMEAMWGILTFALLLSAVSTVKLPRKVSVINKYKCKV